MQNPEAPSTRAYDDMMMRILVREGHEPIFISLSPIKFLEEKERR